MRVGKLTITQPVWELIKQLDDAVADLMANLTIINVRPSNEWTHIDLICVSKHFDDVYAGERIPQYTAEMHREGDVTKLQRFHRVEDVPFDPDKAIRDADKAIQDAEKAKQTLEHA